MHNFLGEQKTFLKLLNFNFFTSRFSCQKNIQEMLQVLLLYSKLQDINKWVKRLLKKGKT